jgi:hypothetical protein
MTLQEIKNQLAKNKIFNIGNYTISPKSELKEWCNELMGIKKSMKYTICLDHSQTKFYDDEVKFDNAIKRILKKLNKEV